MTVPPIKDLIEDVDVLLTVTANEERAADEAVRHFGDMLIAITVRQQRLQRIKAQLVDMLGGAA